MRKRSPAPGQSGLTLLELMVAAAVLAVLAAVAVPMYRQYVLQAQRTEAKAVLLRVAAQQERRYVHNGNRYTADLTRLGFSVPADAPSANGRYLVNVDPGADAAGFTARATATQAMAADTECRELTINEQGERRASPDPRGRCW